MLIELHIHMRYCSTLIDRCEGLRPDFCRPNANLLSYFHDCTPLRRCFKSARRCSRWVPWFVATPSLDRVSRGSVNLVIVMSTKYSLVRVSTVIVRFLFFFSLVVTMALGQHGHSLVTLIFPNSAIPVSPNDDPVCWSKNKRNKLQSLRVSEFGRLPGDGPIC